jgi:PAS domain S-box-containing protein
MILAGPPGTLLLLALGGAAALAWHRRAMARLRTGCRRIRAENRLLAQLANAISLTVDEADHLRDCNDRALDAYGYSRTELLALTWNDLRAPEAEADMASPCARVSREGAARFETIHRRKDGSTFPVEVGCATFQANGQPWVQSILRDISERKGTDITEQKRVEAELRENTAQKLAIIRAIPDLVFTFSRDGTYTAIYASDPSLLYMPMERLLHRNVAAVLPGPVADLFRRGIGAALDFNAVQELDYQLAVDGEDKFFEGRVAPFTRDSVVAIVRDVTERKHAEQRQRDLRIQFNQAQKMESLGSLAGGIAHDMNNVLGAILALASANIEAQPEGSPIRRALATIIEASERGGNLLKGLLNFDRQTPAEERELDLNAILHEEIRLMERTTLSKVRLETDLAEDLRPIRGDASALAHAFMNLCINGVDAMPDHGTLALRTRNLPSGWVEAQVEDTGCGMPKEVLEKACNPFFTTKPVGRGTGLGLSIVYRTVKAHHGQMEIRSEPGQGTCVRVRFPACDLSQASMARPSRSREPG